MKARNAQIAAKEIASGSQVAPGYLIFGEERYWHRRVIDAAVESFGGSCESLSGDEVTWRALRDFLSQPSFFGPQVWVVHGAQSLFESAADARIDYIPEGKCLVLSCPVKDNPAKGDFLELWDRAGGVLLEASELPLLEAVSWVKERLAKGGFAASDDAAHDLVAIAGRRVELLENEIGKIEAYLGSTGKGRAEVTSQVVLQCVSQDPEKTSFGLVDSITARDLGKAVSEYQDLKSRGASPIALISVIASHFALIWRAKEEELKGTPRDSLSKVLAVHPYPARKAAQESRRWTFGQLRSAFEVLCDVDEKLKRGRIDPDEAMDYLISRLCNTR